MKHTKPRHQQDVKLSPHMSIECDATRNCRGDIGDKTNRNLQKSQHVSSSAIVTKYQQHDSSSSQHGNYPLTKTVPHLSATSVQISGPYKQGPGAAIVFATGAQNVAGQAWGDPLMSYRIHQSVVLKPPNDKLRLVHGLFINVPYRHRMLDTPSVRNGTQHQAFRV